MPLLLYFENIYDDSHWLFADSNSPIFERDDWFQNTSAFECGYITELNEYVESSYNCGIKNWMPEKDGLNDEGVDATKLIDLDTRCGHSVRGCITSVHEPGSNNTARELNDGCVDETQLSDSDTRCARSVVCFYILSNFLNA